MLLASSIVVILALLWYFFYEKGNWNKASQDVRKAWRGFSGTFVVPIYQAATASKRNKILSVVIIVVLVVGVLALLLVHPQPKPWHIGINEDQDKCGNVVLVGVIGSDATGNYTEESLKAAGADVIYDPVKDIGKPVNLLKPGSDPSCNLSAGALQSEK